MAEAPDELITIGKIVGAFGIKGWVKLKSYTQPEINVMDYSPWQLRTVSRVEALKALLGRENILECDAYNQRPQGLVAHLKGVDDRNTAELLVGSELVIDKSRLPPLDENDFYWHQLLGLQVVSEFTGSRAMLGEVVDILETGANDVLVVKSTGKVQGIDQRERLIPYLPEQFIKQVDLPGGQIVVDWDPEF